MLLDRGVAVPFRGKLCGCGTTQGVQFLYAHSCSLHSCFLSINKLMIGVIAF